MRFCPEARSRSSSASPDAASRPCCGTSSGFRGPCRGISFMGGQDLFALPERQFRRVRRRFGVLFQDGALLGSLTLAENVGLPLHEHTRLPKATIRSTVLRILDLVGLAEFADYYPNELSGGMKKRGGLARAIVTEPPLLFLRRADLRARSDQLGPNGSASVGYAQGIPGNDPDRGQP